MENEEIRGSSDTAAKIDLIIANNKIIKNRCSCSVMIDGKIIKKEQKK